MTTEHEQAQESSRPKPDKFVARRVETVRQRKDGDFSIRLKGIGEELRVEIPYEYPLPGGTGEMDIIVVRGDPVDVRVIGIYDNEMVIEYSFGHEKFEIGELTVTVESVRNSYSEEQRLWERGQ